MDEAEAEAEAVGEVAEQQPPTMRKFSEMPAHKWMGLSITTQTMGTAPMGTSVPRWRTNAKILHVKVLWANAHPTRLSHTEGVGP